VSPAVGEITKGGKHQKRVLINDFKTFSGGNLQQPVGDAVNTARANKQD